MTTFTLEHLIENRNVKGNVGIFAGNIHPDANDPSSKPGKHWVLCIPHKKMLSDDNLNAAICKSYEYEILDSCGSSSFIHLNVIMDSINSFFLKTLQGT